MGSSRIRAYPSVLLCGSLFWTTSNRQERCSCGELAKTCDRLLPLSMRLPKALARRFRWTSPLEQRRLTEAG